jgi:hypothetical protein
MTWCRRLIDLAPNAAGNALMLIIIACVNKWRQVTSLCQQTETNAWRSDFGCRSWPDSRVGRSISNRLNRSFALAWMMRR